MSKAVVEGLKELVRVAILAAIPVAIALLEGGATDFKVVAVTVAVAVLRALDAWVHNNPKIPLNGISPV